MSCDGRRMCLEWPVIDALPSSQSSCPCISSQPPCNHPPGLAWTVVFGLAVHTDAPPRDSSTNHSRRPVLVSPQTGQGKRQQNKKIPKIGCGFAIWHLFEINTMKIWHLFPRLIQYKINKKIMFANWPSASLVPSLAVDCAGSDGNVVPAPDFPHPALPVAPLVSPSS